MATSIRIARLGRGKARLAVAAALAIVVAGCGGAKVGDTGSSSTPPAASGSNSASPSAAACGTVNLAVNPWVGYEADAAVFAYVAKTKLGCNVVKKDLKEQVSWQGFGTGEVDLILENWGHEDLAKQYITDQKVAVDLGPTGNQGIIGWYVPPWLATAHPDVLDWNNLNKYAAQFKTSESGGKGQLLDGDPSYVTNDAALVKNLKLNFKVVQGGSETALIEAFRSAESQKKFFLAYFYEPQWFFDEMKLVRVTLPPFTTGCDAVAAKVACDYPPYVLNKIASVKFADGGQPGCRAGQEVRVDERRPEPRGQVHRPGQADRRRRGSEVGGRQPGQGGCLAGQLSST